MVSFTTETPVLRFRLQRIDADRQRWLLWPVFAWQVVAPRPRPRPLNILQKAVLGLCRSRLQTPEQIGEKLLVERELVELIIGELRDAGWLDARAGVTAAGLRVLAAEESEPVDEQTVGVVFTDPFTGDVWPRFVVGDLPLVEVELDDQGFPRLLGGTPGDPRRDDAFTLLPRATDVLVRRPDPAEVVRASRAHHRQHGWIGGVDAVDAPALAAVSFVSDRPTPYLVAVRVWRDRRKDIHVDDPFGIGESPRLYRQIKERLDTHNGLRARLKAVLGGDPDSKDPDEIQREAEWEIERLLTATVARWPVMRDDFIAMQRARLEAERFTRAPDKWHDTAVKAQIACESVLIEIIERWPPRTVLARDDARFNEELLMTIASDLGFLPLPDTLRKVKSGKILAATRGDGSLRPLLLAVLLGAPGAVAHPLAAAARRAPDLLDRLDALARTRDPVGHASRRRPRGGLAQDDLRRAVLAGVDTAFTLARLLLELPW